MLRTLLIAATLAVVSTHSVASAADITTPVAPTFDDAKVDVAESEKLWGEFEWSKAIEALTQCSVQPVNFAGKYTVCSVSAGTEAQMNLALNQLTGEVRRMPGSELGIETRFDSPYVVINPDFGEYASNPPKWLYRLTYKLERDVYVLKCADKGPGTECLDAEEYEAATAANE